MPAKKRKSKRSNAPPESSAEVNWTTGEDSASNPHPGFTIEYPSTYPKSKKRKRDDAQILQEPFEFNQSLRVDYVIRPYDRWKGLKQFKKFSIGSQTMGVGDIIYVQNNENGSSQDDAIDIQNQWFGKVLEIRAHDEREVYVRLYWIYRPEDLPDGRRSYHGKNELIPSNHMDVVDAQTVNGKIELRHWKEMDDEDDLEADSLYWRQYLDYRKSTLSAIRKHCIDEAPYNPDTVLINCSNPKCKAWLHAACVEKAAIQKAYRKYIKTDHVPGDAVPEHILSASIKVGSGEASGSRVITTDLREGQDKKQWEDDLVCLVCHRKID